MLLIVLTNCILYLLISIYQRQYTMCITHIIMYYRREYIKNSSLQIAMNSVGRLTKAIYICTSVNVSNRHCLCVAIFTDQQ